VLRCVGEQLIQNMFVIGVIAMAVSGETMASMGLAGDGCATNARVCE
jgi:hypothetical protein